VKQDDQESQLVLHLGALGDLIAIVPAIAELALAGRVCVLGPSAERLELALAPRGPIARVGLLPPGLFAEELAPELASTLARFETIVAFARDEGALARNLRAAGGVLVAPAPSSGVPLAAGREGLHATEIALAGLRERGLAREGASTVPVLRAQESDIARAREAVGEKDFLVVAPGAGGRSKRWAPGRFAEVVSGVVSLVPVVTLLGPAELDPPDPSLRLPGTRVLECPGPSLLLGVLALARAYVGNDSGVTHLAAALGTPVVALFGPTDVRRWAPRGRGPVTVIEAPSGDLGGLGAGPVIAAVIRHLTGGRRRD
jgi:heptosyltransferase-2